MRVADQVRCDDFPCGDVRHAAHHVPAVDVDPATIRVVLVSESIPPDPADGYEAPGDPIFARTTVEAFRGAGFEVATIDDVRVLGVHLTTAVKCAKTAYAIEPATIRTCSLLLEQELGLFPGARSILLMGDVAVRALNEIARRAREPRPVPAGADLPHPRRRLPLPGRPRLPVVPSGRARLLHREEQAPDDRRGHRGRDGPRWRRGDRLRADRRAAACCAAASPGPRAVPRS